MEIDQGRWQQNPHCWGFCPASGRQWIDCCGSHWDRRSKWGGSDLALRHSPAALIRLSHGTSSRTWEIVCSKPSSMWLRVSSDSSASSKANRTSGSATGLPHPYVLIKSLVRSDWEERALSFLSKANPTEILRSPGFLNAILRSSLVIIWIRNKAVFLAPPNKRKDLQKTRSCAWLLTKERHGKDAQRKLENRAISTTRSNRKTQRSEWLDHIVLDRP